MHILLTNDDGPPSQKASPYILSFVQALEAAGHVVSVIVPSEQRSWIGKAHIIGRDVATKWYWPPVETPLEHEDDANGTVIQDLSSREGRDGTQPWVLVDSTPASCAQLGLSGMLFHQRGKIDLVISGPNYGKSYDHSIACRNTTAVFALSSGTLGAALEAAICGHRAIALSFAFFDRNNDPVIVAESCSHAVRVCEHLAAQGPAAWENGSKLYSVNVPLQKGVSQRRVVWTRMLQNQWMKGACFQEVAHDEVVNPDEEEKKVRAKEGTIGVDEGAKTRPNDASEWRPRYFKWAPRFTDVYDSVAAAGPGSDGWAVKEGETSITALRPNFMHVEGIEGEVKL